MKKIITISREFGAGGNEIGRKVAEALGIEYYDKDMVMKIALMDPKLDREMVARWSDRAPSQFSLLNVLCEFYERPMNEQIWNAQKEAVRRLANKESCVIIGREGNYILKEYDHALHVFVHAGFKWRVDRLAAKSPDVSPEEVAVETKRVDRARRRFCEYYTGQDYGAADNFDLCLNVEKLGIDRCVEMILELVKDI